MTMSNTEAEATNVFDITVSYNGVDQTFQVNPNQQVQALLQQVVQAFGMPGNPNNLILVNASSPTVEIPTNVKVGAAGIQLGTRLLLRPRASRGG